ncbi:hypothetical protein M422DRAFT_71012 [Sphaerobolus stellatus SS14]|uniref:Unplaced genomic scaffold SPHSTscaffold_188, whole genome shotgun sequence n=1 Tax=Sphaerobolus stellatus (strain SS14) TaxID=990650 RepID=A0A0C9UNF6_SPHS4|nr:hypothetical protein M422DRAFT_71012 [Sphaerobolus stellatus SS14]
MPGRHTAREMANALLRITDRAEITGRVRCVTTDGASNMSGMMVDYQYLLRDRNIHFDALDSHVVCFPHTLHLAVTAMLDAVTSSTARENVTAPFTSPVAEPFDPDMQSLVEALRRDPVAMARDATNNIRMSQICRNEFLSLIEMGNQKKRWTQVDDNGVEQPVILNVVIPYRDSSNRWGSGYLSNTRFTYLRQPLTYYMEKRPEVFKNRLTKYEWTVLEDIRDILEGPFILQEQMCIERTPMLAGSLAAYESVITALQRSHDKPKYFYLQEMLSAGIEGMQANYDDRRYSRLLILAILVHPALRLKWFASRWTPEQLVYVKRVALEELSKYRSSTTRAPSSPGCRNRAANTNNSSKSKFRLYDNLFGINSGDSYEPVLTTETEFEDYCHAANWPDIETVDIVEWWDVSPLVTFYVQYLKFS